ncbi:hypothetical protein D3C86_2240900 [compost metagenome]
MGKTSSRNSSSASPCLKRPSPKAMAMSTSERSMFMVRSLVTMLTSISGFASWKRCRRGISQ